MLCMAARRASVTIAFFCDLARVQGRVAPVKGECRDYHYHHAIAGREIAEYLDIVSAESVQGINVVRDVFAGMRDFFGGRSQTLERALKEARVQATDEIKERARDLRADAVIGLDYEISMPSGRGGMVVVFVTGTAVRLK
ncbi:hypothetical protein TRE132_36550 [Pseudomonas chlororaphis subsp. aurantiaca]|nr:hypothetical protein TRE132_36550 [Pseudomonas chlororaphis subsp. aurantiaca]